MLDTSKWTQKHWDAHNELARQGSLFHLMHAGQKKFWKGIVNGAVKPKYSLLYTSRQFGKTHSAVIYAISHCIKTPKRMARLIYPTLKLSREVAVPKLNDICDLLPPDVKPVFRRADLEFVFPNGSVIKLGGADPAAADNNRGNFSTLIVLDEAGFFDENTFVYLIFSVLFPQTTHYPDAQIVAVTTPPASITHPLLIKYSPLAKRANAFMTATIYENPMLSKDQITNLMEGVGGENSNAWKREYLAELVQDNSARVVPEYSANNFKTYEIPKTDITFTPAEFLGVICVDYGVSSRDLTAVTASVFDWVNQKMVVVKEATLHAPGLRQTAEVIRHFESSLKADFRCGKVDVIVDMFASTALEFRTEHGVNFRSPGKVKLVDMVAAFRSAIEYDKIIITPDCVKSNDTLLNGLWKKTANAAPTFERTQELGHLDLLACLIYSFRYLPWGAKGLSLDSRKDIMAPIGSLPIKKETFKNAEGDILKPTFNSGRSIVRRNLY